MKRDIIEQLKGSDDSFVFDKEQTRQEHYGHFLQTGKI